MMGFGMGRDLFGGGGMMRPFGGRDPFEGMMDFSRPHMGLHEAGNGGSFVCQTYVSSSTMGKDGKMKQ